MIFNQMYVVAAVEPPEPETKQINGLNISKIKTTASDKAINVSELIHPHQIMEKITGH